MIEEGAAFPTFDLPDQDEAQHRLKDLKGDRFVLFCYPKDDTGG